MFQRTSGRCRSGVVVLGLVVFSLGFVWSPPLSADIEITEDDWENFVELDKEPGVGNAATPLPQVVETDDGRVSLFFTDVPGDNLAYAIYVLDVT